MRIVYLGHSAFRMVTASGRAVVTDPYDGQIGFSMSAVSADVVTVSHDHYDHCAVDAVSGDPEVVRGPVPRTAYGDVEIEGIPSFHDDNRGRDRGPNTVYMFYADGVRVCHMGDIGESMNEDAVAFARGCDALMIPVGGTFTIDARTAKRYVDAIKPGVVIPMHYKVPGLNLSIASADAFAGMFERRTVASELPVTKNDGATRLVVMERRV